MSAILLALLFAFSFTKGEGGTATPQGDLSGAWDVQMTVSATGERMSGMIALVPDSTRRNAWIALPDASYLGVYAIDLKNGGAPASTACPYPMAAARVNGDAEVTIVLNPSQDHGAFDLTGTWRGAKIEGRWTESSYGQGREGTFILRRKQS